MKKFTLITGASNGIGREMAFVCAEKGFNLLLVALADSNLEQLSQELRDRNSVDVDYLELDLGHIEAATDLYDWCMKNDYQVNMLINNVGIGGRENFSNLSLVEIQKMIHLNTYIVSATTNLFLPMLRKQPEAYILNVSSTASYFNIPNKTVYAATKAYVNTFTTGLRNELKDSHVSVSLLCPGGSSHKVDPEVEKKLNNYFTALVHETPYLIAKDGIEGMLKKKKLILPGVMSKLYVLVSKLLPGFLKDRIIRKIFVSSSAGKSYSKPVEKITSAVKFVVVLTYFNIV
jgi:short-subunit dehydrogenase